jgi:beta-galactosidase
VSSIDFDSRAVTIDGRRALLISGEIHYARSPRELWPALLDRSVACGLNCVASYVFWNEHEPRRDVYDFSGNRDLPHFLQLCAERGLHVILRVGPYCCAEWNFGGFPPYLRDEPGISLRTWNAPYLQRVERYFRHLMLEVRAYLASNGGPVILVQVENEYANVARRYGEEGQRYLAWIVDLAKRLGVDVPTITCEGGAPGAIACVNGFSIPPDRLARHQTEHPNVPLLWTELWTGWYDTWGFQHHRRDVRNIAFSLLAFLNHGGSGWNYYMWHGGTNLGRTSMYLQTTSYDFDAPLDEFGRTTPKALFLQRLHQVLREHASLFLEGACVREGAETTWSAGRDSIRLRSDPITKTAQLFDASGAVLFDTSARLPRVRSAWRNLPPLKGWKSWPEPRPAERSDARLARVPVDQLQLTGDTSDYCWYSTTFEVTTPGVQKLDLPLGGDFLYVYCDDRLLGQSRLPLRENRGATSLLTAVRTDINMLESQSADGFRHEFVLRASRGKHRLDILATALGLVKGDWQISGPMETERKGIWHDALLNGRVLSNWEIRPGLVGEQRSPAGIAWRRASPMRPCTWHEVTFATRLERDGDYRLDAAGLRKGLLFLNGRLLGRHWLVDARDYGADEGWHERDRDGLLVDAGGRPTQRYYCLPRPWLKELNQLVVFEEQSCELTRVRLQVRRHAAAAEL